MGIGQEKRWLDIKKPCKFSLLGRPKLRLGIKSSSSQEEGSREPNKSLVKESFVSIHELLFMYLFPSSAEKAHNQGQPISNEHTQLPDIGC